MYAFSHISSFSLTSRSPKTRPKTRVILPKRPKPKKPKKGRPVQSLVANDLLFDFETCTNYQKLTKFSSKSMTAAQILRA